MMTQTRKTARQIHSPIQMHRSRWLRIAIGVSVAVATVAILWRWPMAWIIVALLIFAWLAFLGLPIWLAAIGDEAEVEHDRLTGESRSSH